MPPALLTTAANPSLEGVHHRMPVLLPVERVGLWLRAALSPGELAELFADAAAQPLVWHPVSTEVNRASMDAPWLREPLCEPEGGAPGPCDAPGEVQAPGSVAAAAAATEPSRSGRRRGREGTTERQGVVELSLWDE